jgi:hypothetical protein
MGLKEQTFGHTSRLHPWGTGKDRAVEAQLDLVATMGGYGGHVRHHPHPAKISLQQHNGTGLFHWPPPVGLINFFIGFFSIWMNPFPG